MALQYFQENVVNFFTDASTIDIYLGKKKRSETTAKHVCSGFVQVHKNQQVHSDYRIFPNVTSQFGEIYAVMMALSSLYQQVWYKRNTGQGQLVNQTVFNIFTDSLYTKNCLSLWITRWFDTTNDVISKNIHPTYTPEVDAVPDLMKKDCRVDRTENNKRRTVPLNTYSPVANQEVILHCVGLIVNCMVPINIYHIKGHTGKGEASIRNALNSFRFFNKSALESKETISREYIESMTFWNNYIDHTTREYLKQVLSNMVGKDWPKPYWPIKFYPSNQQIELYKTLIQ